MFLDRIKVYEQMLWEIRSKKAGSGQAGSASSDLGMGQEGRSYWMLHARTDILQLEHGPSRDFLREG